VVLASRYSLLFLLLGACGESPMDPLAEQRACWAAGNIWWGYQFRDTSGALVTDLKGCAPQAVVDSIRAACIAGRCDP